MKTENINNEKLEQQLNENELDQAAGGTRPMVQTTRAGRPEKL